MAEQLLVAEFLCVGLRLEQPGPLIAFGLRLRVRELALHLPCNPFRQADSIDVAAAPAPGVSPSDRCALLDPPRELPIRDPELPGELRTGQ